MQSKKEFIAEAISSYNSMPAETNDLYKKYTVDIQLDPASPETADINACESRIERLSRAVTDKTKIKFDAIISEHTTKSFRDNVKIIRAEDADADMLSSKLFKSNDDKLAAFSNAYSKYFIIVDLPEGKEESLNLLFINCACLPVQVMVRTGSRSKLGMFELYLSDSDSNGTMSVLHEVRVGKDSRVELDALHNEGTGSNVVNLCKSVIADCGSFSTNFIYAGGSTTKAKSIIDSQGVGSSAEVCELAFGNSEQKFDLTTYMTNSKPRSHAKLESGAVLDGKAHCILKGFAKVEKGTKGCFSRITERGILLSRDAHVDALPDMAIDYSNEVKATHSAATSPLDPEHLFYLESRGMDEPQARKTLITSFLAKYISNIGNGVAHEAAMSVMLEKLESGRFGSMPDMAARGVWISR